MGYRRVKVGKHVAFPHGVHLVELADALRRTPPPIFDMVSFATVDPYQKGISRSKAKKATSWLTKMTNAKDLEPDITAVVGQAERDGLYECGTCCCALGTAAYNWIGQPRLYDSWEEYSYKAFGIDVETELWDYIFAQEWATVDNTPAGAANRILHYLTEGTSPLFDEMISHITDAGIGQWLYDTEDYLIKALYYGSEKIKIAEKK